MFKHIQVFGNNMLLLILVSLLQLIWRAYFIITNLTDDPYSLTTRSNVRSLLLCLVFVKRMLFLTSTVHKFDKQVRQYNLV